jgi:outer membrane protein assembly factor BamB
MIAPRSMVASFRVFLVSIAAFLSLAVVIEAENWPSWRGPHGDGSSGERFFPTTWSRDKNIKWSTPLPERGNSSPIVWDGRVFVSQAEEEEQFRSLMSFDRETGKLLWQSGIHYDRPESKHETNTYCATSPVTDGERIYVSYGSAGLYCYDLLGRERWHRNFGPLSHQWGDGSSPVIHGDLIYFFHGPGEGSFLVALNKTTGHTVWQVAQPKVNAGPEREDGFSGNGNGMVGSFATPMVIQAEHGEQLIMAFPESLRSYDLETGRENWFSAGLNPLVYSSPVYHRGSVIAMGGYFGPMISVKVGGRGDVTGTHRQWKSGRTPHRLGTGVVANGYVFVFDRPGFVQCIDPATGESLWQERVRGNGANSAIWGSAVSAGGNIYVVNQSGDTVIVKASNEFEIVAINSLGESTNTTPALSNGEIFIRTNERLWCVADLTRTASK